MRRLRGRVPVHLRAAVTGEDGAATVLAAAVIAVVLVVAAGALLVVRASTATHRARAAADLAALAGAHSLRDGLAACAEVGRIAAANGAVLTRCRVDGDAVVATCVVRVDLGAFGIRPASATARAGP